MAHVDKYHIGAVGHLFKHYERAKDKDGNYIKFSNQNIDLSKTESNYNLARVCQPMPQLAFLRKRLSEVKVFKRSDVKVLCDWVVTLPKGMEKDEQKFFEETFRFLCGRYGEKNVVSAYVHRDETQPHMHFAFIPVTLDKKKQTEKVSAKEVLTRQELQRFHGDLDKYLSGVFGRDTGVLNEATKEGAKSVAELKRGTAVETLRKTQEELKALRDKIHALQWSGTILPVKEKKDRVTLTTEDYEAAKVILQKRNLLEMQAKEAEERAKTAERELKTVLSRDGEKEQRRLRSEIARLETENLSLIADYRALERELEQFYSVLETNPKLREFFMQQDQIYL